MDAVRGVAGAGIAACIVEVLTRYGAVRSVAWVVQVLCNVV